MRTFWGLVLGGLLFFPGTVLVQWAIKSLGIYQNPTVTDACMSIIMVLLTVFVVQHRPVREASAEGRERRTSRQAAGPPPPRYTSDSPPARRRSGRRPVDWDEDR